jgi:hypothetical protein
MAEMPQVHIASHTLDQAILITTRSINEKANIALSKNHRRLKTATLNNEKRPVIKLHNRLQSFPAMPNPS